MTETKKTMEEQVNDISEIIRKNTKRNSLLRKITISFIIITVIFFVLFYVKLETDYRDSYDPYKYSQEKINFEPEILSILYQRYKFETKEFGYCLDGNIETYEDYNITRITKIDEGKIIISTENSHTKLLCGYDLAYIHSHPDRIKCTFSMNDIINFKKRDYKYGCVICEEGILCINKDLRIVEVN